MNPFKCFVCSQDISPKKRKSLKCQNKPCNAQCHYACDREILSSDVAKTIESYYCVSCREEGGQSIIYKKEHFTRRKSTSQSIPAESVAHNSKTASGAPNNDQSETNQGEKEECNTHLDPEVSTNVQDTNVKDQSLHDPEVVKNVTPNKQQNNHETLNESLNATPDRKKISEKDKDKLLMNKNQKINELEEILQLTAKDRNKLKKELAEKTLTLQKVQQSLSECEERNESLNNEIHELNIRKGEQAELKSSQIQLMKDSIAFEIEEKLRFKAKAAVIESKYERLLEIWESKEPKIMSHAITQTNGNLNEVNNLRQQLNKQNEQNKSLELEIKRLQNNQKKYGDMEILHDSLRNLEAENKSLKSDLKAQTNKLLKIENALHPKVEPSPSTEGRHEPSDQPRDENQMYSPVSNTSLNFSNHSLIDFTEQDNGKNLMQNNDRQSRRSSTTDSELNDRSHQHNRKLSTTESELRENEKEQIERKKKNIIIQGMPEMDSNRTARKEFQKMYGFATDRKLEKWDLRKIGRIGDPTEGINRPLKIEFYSMTQKIDFMRNLHHLKNYRIENLVIQHDLTSMQLKQLSEMKQEARRLEGLSDNEDFCFRVRGSPGRWKIVRMPKN